MLRRSTQRRAGVTLIEILVVIGIIATLMGLLLGAVGRAMDVSARADTSSRATGITSAVNTFKSERQVSYIPGGRIDDDPNSTTYGQVVGPFRLRNSYPQSPTGTEPGVNSFEARYLQQVFGTGTGLNIGGATGGNLGGGVRNADLDANQTVLFFLNGLQDPDAATGGIAFRGFSKNPGQPFVSFTMGDDRHRPLLDISNRHYSVASNGYAWLTDGWKRPFAYFAAFNGKPPRSRAQYGGLNNQFPSLPNPMGTPVAYMTGNKMENESGCQVISAGKDGVFGVTGDWNSLDTNGQDDRANFSTSNLGAGPN